MITVASVREIIRTGSSPWALKCWNQALSGIENRLPFCHSRVCFLPPSFHNVVAPWPDRMNTASS